MRGIVPLGLAWVVAALVLLPSASARAAEADGAADAVIGTWVIHPPVLEYNQPPPSPVFFAFRPDGTFSASAGRDSVSGSWQVTAGAVSFSPKPGGQIATLPDLTRWRLAAQGEIYLVFEPLGSASAPAQPSTRPVAAPRQVRFSRVPPFNKGSHDLPKLVGEWRGDRVLTIAASGEFSVRPFNGDGGYDGQWSQVGRQLTVRFPATVHIGLSATRPSRVDPGLSDATLEILVADDTVLCLNGEGVTSIYVRSTVRLPESVAGLQAATRPVAEAPRLKRDPLPANPRTLLVGDWHVDYAGISCTFSFKDNGQFTFSMVEGRNRGEARGAWKLDGANLILDTTSTDIPRSEAGPESTRILSISRSELVLANPHSKHPRNAFTFEPTAAFVRGQRDNPKLIGSWYDPTSRQVLVLAEDGTAIVPGEYYRAWQWSQSGNEIKLLARGLKGTPPSRPDLPADFFERTIRILGQEGDALAVMLPGHEGQAEPRLFARLR